jgi:membrane protein involved in colicin uptake
MIAKEIKRQLPIFQRQLNIIRLYEKKAPEQPAPRKKTLEPQVRVQRTVIKNTANDPDAQKKDEIRAKVAAERAKRNAAIAKTRAARKIAAEKIAAEKEAAEAKQDKVEGAPE